MLTDTGFPQADAENDFLRARRRVIEPRRGQAREIFRRAIERGEVPADLDLEVALDLIYGPLYLRLLQDHAPLDDGFVRAAVDMVIAGVAATSD